MSTYTLTSSVDVKERYVHAHARTVEAQTLYGSTRNLDLTLTLIGDVPPLTGGTVAIAFYDQGFTGTSDPYLSVKPWFSYKLTPPAATAATAASPITITDADVEAVRVDDGGNIVINFPVEAYWPLSGLDAGTNPPKNHAIRIASVTYTDEVGAVTTYDPVSDSGPAEVADSKSTDSFDNIVFIGNTGTGSSSYHATAFVLEGFDVERTAADRITTFSVFPLLWKMYGPPVAGGGTRILATGFQTNLLSAVPQINIVLPSGDIESVDNPAPDTTEWTIYGQYLGTDGAYTLRTPIQCMSALGSMQILSDYIYLQSGTSGTSNRLSSVYPGGSSAPLQYIPSAQGTFTVATGLPTFYAVPQPLAAVVIGSNVLRVKVYTPAQTSEPFTNDGTTSLFTVQARVRRASDLVGTVLTSAPSGFSWASSVVDGTNSARAVLAGPASMSEADLTTGAGVVTLKFPFEFALGTDAVSIDVSLVETSVTLQNMQTRFLTVPLASDTFSVENLIDTASSSAHNVLDGRYPANAIPPGSLTIAEKAQVAEVVWTAAGSSGSAPLTKDGALIQVGATKTQQFGTAARLGQEPLFFW